MAHTSLCLIKSCQLLMLGRWWQPQNIDVEEDLNQKIIPLLPLDTSA